MKHWYKHSWLVLVGFLAVQPSAADIVINFTGVVTEVDSFNVNLPAGVTIDRELRGRIAYNPAAAEWVADTHFSFPGADFDLSIMIGNQMWTSEYSENIDVLNYTSEGHEDHLIFVGQSLAPENYRVTMYVWFMGGKDLLNGDYATVPDSEEDINFGATSDMGGLVSSSSGFPSFWSFRFTTQTVTLPVTASTWGAVKALYARP